MQVQGTRRPGIFVSEHEHTHTSSLQSQEGNFQEKDRETHNKFICWLYLILVLLPMRIEAKQHS